MKFVPVFLIALLVPGYLCRGEDSGSAALDSAREIPAAGDSGKAGMVQPADTGALPDRAAVEAPTGSEAVETAGDTAQPAADIVEAAGDTAQPAADTMEAAGDTTPPAADTVTTPSDTIQPQTDTASALFAPGGDSIPADSVSVEAGAARDSIKPDSIVSAVPDSIADTSGVDRAVASPDSSQPDTSGREKAASKVKPKKKKKRNKVFRESRINTIDEMKGNYRSPKKALFMSLILPGLGQAYVGHYIRASLYFALEAALGMGWYHYVVVKYDRQVKKYERFADKNWSHANHELKIEEMIQGYDIETMKELHPHREEFCNAIFPNDTPELKTCTDFSDDEGSVTVYTDLPHVIYALEERGVEDIYEYRHDAYRDLHDFYELIGKYDEFITGWDDNSQFSVENDSVIAGFSSHRLDYRDMRKKATEYSRMQAWFLGGMVLNHLVSAVDAALSARFHNKKLYQTEVKWYDRIKLDSYFSFTERIPASAVRMRLPF